MNDKQRIRARQWARDHASHVIHLVFSTKDKGYPPSSEDINHPELWKAEHWSWFFK